MELAELVAGEATSESHTLRPWSSVFQPSLITKSSWMEDNRFGICQYVIRSLWRNRCVWRCQSFSILHQSFSILHRTRAVLPFLSCFPLKRVNLVWFCSVQFPSQFFIGHSADSVHIDCNAKMNHSYLLKGFNRWVSVCLSEEFAAQGLIELRHDTNSTHVYSHTLTHDKKWLSPATLCFFGWRFMTQGLAGCGKHVWKSQYSYTI